MRKYYLTGLLAASLLAAPAQAGDTTFTPDAAATWSVRTIRMAHVVDLANPRQLTKNDFKMACDGLTGEQMKHEYGKEPRWALSAQLTICSAFDGWAGKFQGSKSPCKTLEKGLKDLDHATAAAAPPEVVAAAQAMRATGEHILLASKEANACKV